MTSFDLIIRGGTVVTAGDRSRCDVGIRSGRVVALAEHLSGSERTIDATGRLVLPGGIDAHCHLDQPRAQGLASGGAVMADDFKSGSLSAAFGGTTTIIPFAVQHRGQSLREAVADYHRRAAGKAYVDYAFHLVVSGPDRCRARPRVAGAGRGRLHLAQGLYDLRGNAAVRWANPGGARRQRGSARW